MASMCGSIYYGDICIGEITQMPTISAEECEACTFPIPKVATVEFTCTIEPEAVDRLMAMYGTEEMRREVLDLYRGDWWKRGEGEPEYLADLHEADWWSKGDDPPDYDMAA